MIRSAVFMLGSLAVYFHCCAPAFFPDDSPWTITAIFNLELQHPPGYPLFTLLGHLWGLLPVGGYAFRTSLLAAALTAAVGVLLVRLIETVLPGGRSRAVAAIAGCTFLLGWTAWGQALSCKGGVYALNLIFTLALLRLVLGPGAPARTWPLAGLALGLGLANHWMSIAALVPVLLAPFLLWRSPELTWRRAALLAAFAAVGVSAYLVLPLRAGHGAVNWGDPGTWRRFWAVVSRAQYAAPALTTVAWAYTLKKAAFVGRLFLQEWTVAGVIVLGLGAAAAVRTLPRAAGVLGGAMLLNVLSVLIFWQKPEDHFFNLAPFFLPAFACGAVFIGLGLAWLIESGGTDPGRRARAVGVALGLAVGALVRLPSHDLSRMHLSSDFGANLLAGLPARTVLLCEADLDWFAVLYQRFVEGRRPDVTPVCFLQMRLGDRTQLRHAFRAAPETFLALGRGFDLNPRSPRPVIGTIEVDSFATGPQPGDGDGSPTAEARGTWSLDHGLVPIGMTQQLPGAGRTSAASIRLLGRLRYRGLWWAETNYDANAPDLIQASSMAWLRVAMWLVAENAGRVPGNAALQRLAYARAVALPMCPAEAQVRYNYAYLLHQDGQWKRCEAVIARAVQLEPGFEPARRMLAVVRAELAASPSHP